MRIILIFLALVACAFAAKLEIIAGGGTFAADAPATQCKLREPFAVEFTPDGRMIIAEMISGNRVLSVDKTGKLTLLAGTGIKGFSGDGGTSVAAQFNGIHNAAIAKNGDIFLADSWNYRIRKLSPDGTVTTFAGTGKKGFVDAEGKSRRPSAAPSTARSTHASTATAASSSPMRRTTSSAATTRKPKNSRASLEAGKKAQRSPTTRKRATSAARTA